MNFAIIGASGNVGRKTIEILEKSKNLSANLEYEREKHSNLSENYDKLCMEKFEEKILSNLQTNRRKLSYEKFKMLNGKELAGEVINIGTFFLLVKYCNSIPFFTNSFSKVNEHPRRKTTKSLLQIFLISVDNSEKIPFLKILYSGISVLISEFSAIDETNSPGSKTSTRGQGFGFLIQNKVKSKA